VARPGRRVQHHLVGQVPDVAAAGLDGRYLRGADRGELFRRGGDALAGRPVQPPLVGQVPDVAAAGLDGRYLRAADDGELLRRDGDAVVGVPVDAGLSGDEHLVEHRRHGAVARRLLAVAVQQLDVCQVPETPHRGVFYLLFGY